MSTTPIPVFDPQGVLRDVPPEMLAQAVKSGGMPAVRFQAPDKSIRFVPADRTQEARQAGGQILPFEQQDVKHPGFWAAIYDDVSSMPGGVLHAMATSLPASDPEAMAWQMQERGKAATAILQNSEQEKAEGHGLPYRVGSVVAQTAGANVPGMEESAREGDVGGVAGHAAAVPAVMAATEGAGRVAPYVADAARSAAPVVSPALKAAVAGRIPDALGASAGAYLGHATGLPEGGLIGAFAGREIGAAFRAKLSDVLTKSPAKFISDLDATGENAPYAGEKPPKALAWNAHDATGENKPFAGGMDEAKAPGKAGSMVDSVTIPPRYTPPPEAAPQAASVQPAPMAKTPSGASIPRNQAPSSAPSDPLLERLRNIAEKIQHDEAKAPTRKASAETGPRIPDPDEDLVGILQQSIQQVQQKQPTQ